MLTQADIRLEGILSNIDGLSHTKINAEQTTFEFKGDANSQHELLKTLLEHKLPVCEFGPVNINLQDAYLSTVKK